MVYGSAVLHQVAHLFSLSTFQAPGFKFKLPGCSHVFACFGMFWDVKVHWLPVQSATIDTRAICSRPKEQLEQG